MSVRTFWLAGGLQNAETYSADSGNNAVEPTGDVYQGVDEKRSLVHVGDLEEGLAQAVRAAALCNIAA